MFVSRFILWQHIKHHLTRAAIQNRRPVRTKSPIASHVTYKGTTIENIRDPRFLIENSYSKYKIDL